MRATRLAAAAACACAADTQAAAAARTAGARAAAACRCGPQARQTALAEARRALPRALLAAAAGSHSPRQAVRACVAAACASRAAAAEAQLSKALRQRHVDSGCSLRTRKPRTLAGIQHAHQRRRASGQAKAAQVDWRGQRRTSTLLRGRLRLRLRPACEARRRRTPLRLHGEPLTRRRGRRRYAWRLASSPSLGRAPPAALLVKRSSLALVAAPYPALWASYPELVPTMLVARDAGALACTSSRGTVSAKLGATRRAVAPRFARPRRVATRASLELDPEAPATTEQALQARARAPPPAVGWSGHLRRHRFARILTRATCAGAEERSGQARSGAAGGAADAAGG